MSRAVFAEKATLASERAKEFISTGGSVVARARALVSGDAQFFAVQPKTEDLRRQLDAESLFDKRDAMKRIIAQMCKGHDMSNLFADVVKNIHNPSIELRKLIYFYVSHYAEDRPNEALLSISAFQKDLLNPSMHVRSLALRMLSTMRIPAIQPLVMVAVKKCATDLEPLVRKTAAISLAQMHAINGSDEDKETVDSLLHLLLADKCTEVASAAALSFMEICPDDMGFIHSVYRSLCRTLVDCEEWGQVVLLHVLLRYARTQFCDPNKPPIKGKSSKSNKIDNSNSNITGKYTRDKKNNNNNTKINSPSSSGSESESSASSKSNNINSRASSSLSSSSSSSEEEDESESEDYFQHGEEGTILLDPDHRLLLDSAKPLFMSLNSAVVVATTSLFYHCAPHNELELCVRPLLRLLGGPEEHHFIILSTIYTIILSQPEPFIPFVKEFFILPQDVKDVRELKIRIMSKLVTRDNFNDVYREFRVYVRSFHVDRVIDAVRGLGLIVAQSKTTCASQIMRLLIPLLSHKNTEVVTESIIVLRLLVVVQGPSKGRTCQLVHRLMLQVMRGEISSASAKASILWLIGENIQQHSVIAATAPECFRVFVKSFAEQQAEVKKQILTLGCKIWLFLDGNSDMADRFRKLFFYMLELAKFDDDYDVRDRGRLLQCTVDRQSETFTALKTVLLSEKPAPQLNDPYVEHAQYQLGTMSHLFGHPLFGYRDLPAWQTEPSDSQLRGVGVDDESDDESDDLMMSSSGGSSDGSVFSTEYSSEETSFDSDNDDSSNSNSDNDDSNSDNSDSNSRIGKKKGETGSVRSSSSSAESQSDNDENKNKALAVNTSKNNNNNNNNNNDKHMSTGGMTATTTTKRVPVKVVVRKVNPTATSNETKVPTTTTTTMNNNNNNDINTPQNDSTEMEMTDTVTKEKNEMEECTSIEEYHDPIDSMSPTVPDESPTTTTITNNNNNNIDATTENDTVEPTSHKVEENVESTSRLEEGDAEGAKE